MRHRRAAVVGATLASLLLAPAGPTRAASAGQLDRAFADHGRALVDFGARTGAESPTDVLVRSHGRVLTVGTVRTRAGSSLWGLSLLLGNGEPDRSFHHTGHRTVAFSGPAAATRVVGLVRGRFLVAGSAHGRFALARFEKDGDLDRAFGGGDGKVTTDITPGTDRVLDVRVEPGGRILTAGTTGTGFAYVRYLPNGTRDDSFGDHGVLRMSGAFVGTPATARLQPDGRLLVVGTASTGSGGEPQFSISRYRTDGSLDQDFGSGGHVSTGFGLDDEESAAAAVLPMGDGRFVVAGSSYELGRDDRRLSIARYLPDGSLDPSFGGDGRTTTFGAHQYAALAALSRQRDGRIVAAGWTDTFVGAVRAFVVVRYTVAGEPDPSFSEDGQASFSFSTGPLAHRLDQAAAVGARDGRIVVAGPAGQQRGSTHVFGVARLRS